VFYHIGYPGQRRLSQKNDLQKDTEVFEMANQSLIGEFWEFLRVRKRYWLLPIALFLLLMGMLIVFAESSAIAPFIYTLF